MKKQQANNKTIASKGSVREFLAAVEPQRKREDALQLLALFEEVTGEPAVMWGSSIIGFGQYHYRYDSGREGDMCKTGFSPRKQNLVLYIMHGFESSQDLRDKLGKHKVGESCLYINKLEDVHLPTLKKLVKQDYKIMSQRYDCNDK